jgi:putative oxidoreductase
MFTALSKNVLIPLLLRLGLAAMLIFHGLNRVGGPDNAWGANWSRNPDPPAKIVQMGVAWGQVIGGILLVVGFLTRLAALGTIVMMLGMAADRWSNGFDVNFGGWEYPFALIIMSLCLVLGGPGPIAVDRFFRFRRRET